MPDRIIRDELLTSERYWSVGMEAQRIFVHLLLSADALGRFSGKNYTIRAACYPGIAVDPKVVEKLISDMADADLIRIYTHLNERYIFIPRYKQRLRAKCSYLPEPPNGINDIADEKSAPSPREDRLESASGRRKEGRKEGTTFQGVHKAPPNPVNSETWEAYSAAYAFRYGTGPVRNAAVNSHIANLVKRLGNDAPQVAAFFLTHNDQWYVKKRHPTDALLKDAEGLHTQWKTGRKATGLEARSAEQKDSVGEQIKRVTAIMEGKKNGKLNID